MSMERAWGVHGVLWRVRGVSMERPWRVHGQPIGCPWAPMSCTWGVVGCRGVSGVCRGVSMGSLRSVRGVSVALGVVGCPWAAARCPWSVREVSMGCP